MKKLVIIILSLMCVNVAYARREKKEKVDLRNEDAQTANVPVTQLDGGGIKFHIEDKDAPSQPLTQISGQKCWEKILSESGISASNANVKTHSAGDSKLVCFDRNACFEGFLTAFDNHYSLVLSPDMIWLLISQGISTQINQNAEQLRDRLVDFGGQRELVVMTQRDVFAHEEDWDWIIQAFSDSIDRNMKAQFSDLMVCNFSTTGTLERITSQITMMESVKKYFKYVLHYMGCGIPDITLLGTPDDWKEIRSRINRLDALALGWWREKLEPVLDEFVNASEGNVNRKFWLDMVQQYSPARAAKGGGCGGTGITKIPAQYNGWFTVFFPFCEEEDGFEGPLHVVRTPSVVTHNTKVCSEIKKVDIKYIMTLPDHQETDNLELWAGFIGMEMDWENHSLKPAMSWMMREKIGSGLDMDKLDPLEVEFLNEFGDGRTDITMNEIYTVFGSMNKWYNIGFPDVPMFVKHPGEQFYKNQVFLSIKPITVPQDLGKWYDWNKLESLTIKAPMTDEQKADILRQVPTAIVVPL